MSDMSSITVASSATQLEGTVETRTHMVPCFGMANPKAFKSFFRDYPMQQSIKYEGLGWEKTPCPVQLENVSRE